MHEKDINRCTAFNIEIKLEYGYKPLKIFWKSTKDLDNYLEMCTELLNSHDLNTVIERAKILYMTEVLKKLEINTYREILPVKKISMTKK